MKYYLIAGESSGDSHAASVIQNIKSYDSHATFRGFGGVKMRNVGAKIDRELSYLSFMGFTQVIWNFFTILKNFFIAQNSIKSFHPDVIILVDYPGFNIRMAKWCKKNGYNVIYYISPQIWAWKYHRIYTIKKYVDKMLCILPFEKSIYIKEHIEAHYVTHPLLQNIVNKTISKKSDYIALFPGSRKQEIDKHLPILCDIAKIMSHQRFILAGIGSIKYKGIPKNITTMMDNPHDVLHNAEAAIVASGTATLEAGLINIPSVVIYKTNRINYLIAKNFVKLKWISLVNILTEQTLFPECIQHDCNAGNIIEKLEFIKSQNTDFRKLILEKMYSLPMENAAKIIYDFCEKNVSARR